MGIRKQFGEINLFNDLLGICYKDENGEENIIFHNATSVHNKLSLSRPVLDKSKIKSPIFYAEYLDPIYGSKLIYGPHFTSNFFPLNDEFYTIYHKLGLKGMWWEETELVSPVMSEIMDKSYPLL